MNYAPLIRLPYHDVSGVIEMWADSCDSMAVYEHEADASVKTTHVHMIMIGCIYKTAEPLKRAYYKAFPAADKSEGNGLWSWTNKDWSNPNIEFITYMSKGHLRPKFIKNISPDIVEELRGKWSEPTRALAKLIVSNDNESNKKLTKSQIIKAAYDYFLNKCPLLPTGQKDASKIKQVPDTEILRCIRRILIDNEQPLGLYKVMDLYDGFVMFHNKDKFLANCLNILEKRLPRV